MNRLDINFYTNDAIDVAKDLIGKVIVVNSCGGCNFKWRIIETEAYKEDENDNGQTICHTNEKLKSCGKIFAESNNGLIVTCKDTNKCDNVLIRGVLTIFNSQPFKTMKSVVNSFNLNLETPIDLTSSNEIYIEQSQITNVTPFESVRVGLGDKSDKKWNFKLFDLNGDTGCISIDYLKGLNGL